MNTLLFGVYRCNTRRVKKALNEENPVFSLFRILFKCVVVVVSYVLLVHLIVAVAALKHWCTMFRIAHTTGSTSVAAASALVGNC